MFHIRTVLKPEDFLPSCFSGTCIPALLLVSIGITLKTKKMKLATNNLSSLKHLFGKILFSSQLIIISTALPVLYCVGVSHNVKKTNKVIIIKTNKGKTIMELEGSDDKTIHYPSGDNNSGI